MMNRTSQAPVFCVILVRKFALSHEFYAILAIKYFRCIPFKLNWCLGYGRYTKPGIKHLFRFLSIDLVAIFFSIEV